MKRQLILTFILALGIGVAAGSYFAPELRKVGAFLGPTTRTGDSSHAPTRSASSTQTSSSPLISDVALSSLLSEPTSFHQTDSLLAYVRSIAPEDIPDALRQIQKHTGGGRDQALSLLISRWVESDPKGAQDAITTTGDGQIRYLLTRTVFTALAVNDPTDAMRQAQELPTQGERDPAILFVIQQMARQNPAEALTVFQHAKSYYGGALGAIFTQWTDTDLSGATQAAFQLPHANDRTSAIQSIAIRLVQSDPEAAKSWLEQLQPGEAQDRAREEVVARLANKDPASAAEYVHSLKQVPADVEIDLVQNVAMYWSQTDPMASTKWAATLTDPQARNVAVQVSVQYWAKTDPRAAVDFVNTLPPQKMGSSSMLQVLASTWATSDPQAALNWANQLPEGDGRDGAFRSAINQWAGASPDKAAAYVDSMPDGKLKKDEIAGVADTWAANDPASAARWISSLPDATQKGEIYATLVRTWAKSSPVDASDWLTQLPAGPVRDTTVRSFSEQIAGSDPAAALQWAESIGDTNNRQGEVEAVLRRWQSIDPAGAAAAVQRSSLPQEQKNRLQQQFQ